jgi:hypothetical protein
MPGRQQVNITTTNSESFWTKPPSLIQSHRTEFEFAMAPNWDNGRGVAITPAVIDLADYLLSRYASENHLVEVGPNLDGSISLLWDDNNGNYVYLSVGPNDTVHLYYDVVGLPKWEGVGLASDRRILDELKRAFRFLHPVPQPELYINLPLSTLNSDARSAA